LRIRWISAKSVAPIRAAVVASSGNGGAPPRSLPQIVAGIATIRQVTSSTLRSSPEISW